ncbi:MAG: hypothetical protein AB8G96_01405 [Phycisphaerales bacterium]
MSRSRLIVLKFGGSVLLDEDRLRVAVHEVQRWRRQGWRVVAVVSALAGQTDALLRSCRSDADPWAVAATLARGEGASAALLGAHLDRAGLPASVLTPGEAGLHASGDPLDARPTWLDAARVLGELRRHGVVVLPGFVAVDHTGRTVTLGRGGSDLSALFVASELGADRCRLIKDVDGLYASDPSSTKPPPPRYARCSIEAALETDGSIIQHKAARIAGEAGQTFELGRVNGVRPTEIGPGISRWDAAADQPRRLRVVVAGPGTVGGGVINRVLALPEHFELSGVVVRDRQRANEFAGLEVPIHTSIGPALGAADVVVETIGGTDVARTLARDVLVSGRHLVTANKTLVAQDGAALDEWAAAGGGRWTASASVGGALPAIERVRAAAIRRVRGVLNGTANFVLERMREGSTRAVAVDTAQRLGFAEADCERDLDGRDALDKLRVLAWAAGWNAETLVATRSPWPVVASRATDGGRWRQVATLEPGAAHVAVESVMPGDPLYDLPDEWNALVIERADGRVETLRGRGAGRWPTAESIVGDLLELARSASRVGTSASVRGASDTGRPSSTATTRAFRSRS